MMVCSSSTLLTITIKYPLLCDVMLTTEVLNPFYLVHTMVLSITRPKLKSQASHQLKSQLVLDEGSWGRRTSGLSELWDSPAFR